MNSGTFMAFMAFRLETTVAILAKEASIMTSNKFLRFVPDGMTFYQWGSKAIFWNKEQLMILVQRGKQICRWKSGNFNQNFHPTASNSAIYFLTTFSANLYHKVGKRGSISTRRWLIALCEQEKAEKAREDPWLGTLGTFGPLVECPGEVPVSAFPCVGAPPRWEFNSGAVLTAPPSHTLAPNRKSSVFYCREAHCNISSCIVPSMIMLVTRTYSDGTHSTFVPCLWTCIVSCQWSTL